MLKSRKSMSFGRLNQSKQNQTGHQKRYKCQCCRDKKYPDYNRQNRLKRQSNSLKRLSSVRVASDRYNLNENCRNFTNRYLTNSIENYNLADQQLQQSEKLGTIVQSPNSPKKDKNSGIKTPIIDMKSYCKSLFQTSKKKRETNRIEVNMQGQQYFVEFDSNQKMKLALGQLKLLINTRQKLESRIP